MAIKVAINGFGRIGRYAARIIAGCNDLELVAINDTTEFELVKYLLKYNTAHSEFNASVELENDDLLINNREAKMLHTRDINGLDFAEYGAQLVFECTDAHLAQEKYRTFLNKSIKKVLMSIPAKDNTPTLAMGVNSHLYKGRAIISNAPCATNCLGPVCRVLRDNFGIEKSLMTTIHAYTNGQSIIDAKARDKHHSRTAVQNIIPTSTGAAEAMKPVTPELDGKLHGQSMHVPIVDVSSVDLTAPLSKEVSKEELNEAFGKASKTDLEGALAVDDKERVSSDFITLPFGVVVVSDLTQMIDEDFVKVVAWYDNEWGYSGRLVDMAVYAVEA